MRRAGCEVQDVTRNLPDGPAYRIDTARLRLRCWRPQDASLEQSAVTSSLTHLRPWMAWATHEPLGPADRVTRMRARRGEFDLGRDYTYGVFAPDESQVWGGAGLHLRPELKDGREIGYWVHIDHLRRGYATELSAALVRIAFEVDGLARVQIRCDPQNVPSAGIPRKLGFSEPVLERASFDMGDGVLRDTLLFTLRAEQYADSPSRRYEVQAFDVLDARIL